MDYMKGTVVLLLGSLISTVLGGQNVNNTLLVLVVDGEGGQNSAVVQGFNHQLISHTNHQQLHVQVQHFTPKRHLEVDIETLTKVHELSSSVTNSTFLGASLLPWCSTSGTLSSLFNELSLCHVQVSDITCPPRVITSPGVVDITPDLPLTIQRVVDLLFLQGEEKFLFFFDSRYMSLLAPVFSRTWRSHDVWMFQAEMFQSSDDVTMTRLISLRASHLIILAVLTRHTLDILHKARNLDFFGPQHTWILFNLDQEPDILEASMTGAENLIMLDLRARFQGPDFVDLLADVPHTLTLPEQDLTVAIQLALNTCCCQTTEVDSFVDDQTNKSQSETPNLRDAVEEATSYAVWSTQGDGHPNLQLEGFWNPHNNSSVFPTPLVKPFVGFHGRVFNVTSKPNQLFQILLPNGTFTGLAFDILNELGRNLNFSYIVTQPPDNQWGIEQEDGRWNGMVGHVKRHEVDFGVASFTITPHREAVIDFTTPFWQGSHAMVMRTNAQGNKLFVYLNPFKTEVWLCLLAMLPVCGGVLWFMTHFTPFYNHNATKRRNESLQRHRKLDLPTTTLLVLGGQLNQGMPWRPKSWSGRLLVGLMWLYFLVVSAIYTGNLIAALAVPSIKAPVDTLSELASQTKYTVGLVQGQALVQVLRSAKGGDFRAVWQQVSTNLEANVVANLDDGFDRVLSEQFIFMDDTKNVVAKVAEANDCSLHIAREEFYYTGYGFPLQHGAPYLDLFNRAILRMIESGHINQWMRRYWPQLIPCGSTFGDAGKPLTLQDTEGAFLLLFSGCCLAIIILLLECFLVYIAKHRRLQILQPKKPVMPDVCPK